MPVTWLCLLRGVNVGGVVLKMEDFRSLLEGLGYKEVRTLIQSGNAVFEAPGTAKAGGLEARIATALAALLGRDIGVFVFPEADLAAALEAQPFDPGLGGDKIFFTLASGSLDPGRLEALLASLPGPEDFRLAGPGAAGLSGRLLYGAYPAGYGTSKYSNNYLEKRFSVMATTRNLNTMERLLSLARERKAKP